MIPSEDIPHIYIVSGGTGFAGNYVVKALLVQFQDVEFPMTLCPYVLNKEEVEKVVIKAKNTNGVIAHTMVDKNMRMYLLQLCIEQNIPNFDFMGEMVDFIANKLGIEPLNQPGLYMKLNHNYFDRIEAIEFTMATDDGLSPSKILNADIVLTGISRSGKTPLSIYLAMFGWKVANVPLVKDIPPPEELFKIDSQRVFGLFIKVENVIAQRRLRVAQMGKFDASSYLNQNSVNEEIEYAERIFRKGGFTTIDVTNKPIENTSNEILEYYQKRFDTYERHQKIH